MMYHVDACRSTKVDENYHMEKETCVTICKMDTYVHKDNSTSSEYNLSRSAMNKNKEWKFLGKEFKQLTRKENIKHELTSTYNLTANSVYENLKQSMGTRYVRQ